MTVIGVDPGGATTGVVLRSGRRALRAELVSPERLLPFESYLNEVVLAVGDFVDAASEADDGPPLLAIEDLVHPNPHLGIANVDGLLAAAQVLGALRWVSIEWVRAGLVSQVVIVPPGRHGSAPLATYPAGLVGATEKRGSGRRRHVRSAWDIAGAGARIAASPDLGLRVP